MPACIGENRVVVVSYDRTAGDVVLEQCAQRLYRDKNGRLFERHSGRKIATLSVVEATDLYCGLRDAIAVAKQAGRGAPPAPVGLINQCDQLALRARRRSRRRRRRRSRHPMAGSLPQPARAGP
jgi:hypothetical protein